MLAHVGTYWHILGLGRVGIQPSPPFIHWDNSFSSHWDNSFSSLGRILGRCLCNRRKTTFSYFRGKAFLGKPARCLCHGNEHRGTDPNTSNSGHHDSSRNAVFLCTADKLQCCHMLASCTQHTQPSPTFIQHSFKQWVHLSFQVLSFENSHWAGLGRILRHCLHNRRKTTFSYFRGKAFLGKPARCLCHGNEHRGTDPNTSNSGHHDSSIQ